jgi:predicted phosphoribosyltransferase
MGAIASGGAVVLNHEIITRFDVSAEELEAEAARQAREVSRRVAVYRSGVPAIDVSGRNVILVDDGMATGASMQVAVQALRQYRPDRVIVGVPVAAVEGCELLSSLANDVVCAEMPGAFEAVGLWYEDFEQTSDAEVVALLAAARRGGAAKQRAS